jgi:hypothetical protein
MVFARSAIDKQYDLRRLKLEEPPGRCRSSRPESGTLARANPVFPLCSELQGSKLDFSRNPSESTEEVNNSQFMKT